MAFLPSLGSRWQAAVFGSTGGIGTGFVQHLLAEPGLERLYAFSRSGAAPDHPKVASGRFDLTDEASIEAAIMSMDEDVPLRLVVVATGALHGEGDILPEKSWRDVSADSLAHAYALNAIGPALIAKHALPRLPREGKAVFAAISARVGSISDNGIGGWYGYRAGKSALNQLIKTFSIELSRKHREAVCVGLHPGTVDTDLSAPFQKNVPEKKLFTPDYATGEMLSVLDGLGPDHSGRLFAYDGQEIAP